MRPTRQYCPHDGYWIGADAIWCSKCYAERLQARAVAASEEANELKRQELGLRREAEWVESRPRPRPTYVLPPQQAKVKGGMQIEPRRRES